MRWILSIDWGWDVHTRDVHIVSACGTRGRKPSLPAHSPPGEGCSSPARIR